MQSTILIFYVFDFYFTFCSLILTNTIHAILAETQPKMPNGVLFISILILYIKNLTNTVIQ